MLFQKFLQQTKNDIYFSSISFKFYDFLFIVSNFLIKNLSFTSQVVFKGLKYGYTHQINKYFFHYKVCNSLLDHKYLCIIIWHFDLILESRRLHISRLQKRGIVRRHEFQMGSHLFIKYLINFKSCGNSVGINIFFIVKYVLLAEDRAVILLKTQL